MCRSSGRVQSTACCNCLSASQKQQKTTSAVAVAVASCQWQIKEVETKIKMNMYVVKLIRMGRVVEERRSRDCQSRRRLICFPYPMLQVIYFAKQIEADDDVVDVVISNKNITKTSLYCRR